MIIAETSLETIPQEIKHHPQIHTYITTHRKKREFTILDKSYHYKAMLRIVDKERRGRPDIIHLTLLEAFGSPLNLEGLLRVHVHTYSNKLISFKPEIRLPRNYNRFIGLMEQLFEKRKVPPQGECLMALRGGSLDLLLKEINPDHTVALSVNGRHESPFSLSKRLAKHDKTAVIVGGFPHGYISEQSLKLVDEQISIDPSSLDAWVVTSHLLAAYEIAIGLTMKRFQRLDDSTPENSRTRKT